jgi:hypothetical protein
MSKISPKPNRSMSASGLLLTEMEKGRKGEKKVREESEGEKGGRRCRKGRRGGGRRSERVLFYF